MMVAEEVRAALREFSSTEDEAAKKKPKKKDSKGGGRPETKDAADEPTKGKSQPPDVPKASPPPGENGAGLEDPVAQGDEDTDPIPGDDEELPGDDEMADDQMDAAEDEDDAIDPEGDAGEDEEGEVAQAIQNLSVQSLTIEPDSALLPGSEEIVFTFNESPDVLRILVDNVGNVVFSWNGQLHDFP